MAQIVKIKRSTTTAVPNTLSKGELAYSSTSDKLFVGNPDDSAVEVIGGKLYVDMLDHTAGTLTASSALIADASSKLNILNVDNITFNGNTISSTDTNGDLNITPNGTGDVVLDGVKWPQADGSANQILTTNGSGQASWTAPASSSFTLSADTGTNDSFNTGGTLTFTGGDNIDTVVTNDTITFNGKTDAEIRALVSVTDAGGDGSLAYNNGTGVITYTGPSAAEARAHISVTDAGGDGSAAYNSTTGVITYTGPSASEVRAHLSAGTGMAYSGGEFSTTITQYTEALVRGDVSVTDAGGDGSLAYNSSTGVFTYTGPSAAEVRAHITAGTGVGYSGGEISIGQAVATTSDVTFNNVTVDGTLNSDDITATNITTSNNLTVTGNLTVNGTTTTVNTATMTVEDPLMALASGNNAADAVDIGLYGLYDTSGSQDLYSGLFRDADDSGKWKLFKDNQALPGTTVDTSGTGYATATLVANIEAASATITGGSVTGITDLAVADGGTGRSTFTSNGILYGNGTSGINATAAGADGYILVSNSGTPTWTNTVDGGSF